MAARAQEVRPSLTIVRRLKASPAKVFAAWTDAKALSQWFGPSDEFGVLSAQADACVGGRFRIVARSPDGEQHEVSGIYREVVPDEKLVFTWAWRSTPERESLVTVALRALPDGGTELTLTHERFFDEPARDRHREGWNGSFDRLERFLG